MIKALLIIAALAGIFVFGLQIALSAATVKSEKKQKRDPGTGYLVTVTRFKPYHVDKFELLSIQQVDTLVNHHCGTLQFDFEWGRILSHNNHFRMVTDSVDIYVERKEIRKNNNGEPVLRRRKMKEVGSDQSQ